MKKLGFTLIELLIVIAIVGILTALILPNLTGARARARDSRRKLDLNNIQQALRLYHNDAAAFPLTGLLPWGSPLVSGNGATSYMTLLPLDPSSSSSAPKLYDYISDGTEYVIVSKLENKSDPDIADSQARCPHTYGSANIASKDTTLDYVVCEE